MPSGFFYPYKLDESIYHFRGLWYKYFLQKSHDFFMQTASDLGLHCLPMSFLWEAPSINGLKTDLHVLTILRSNYISLIYSSTPSGLRHNFPFSHFASDLMLPACLLCKTEN